MILLSEKELKELKKPVLEDLNLDLESVSRFDTIEVDAGKVIPFPLEFEKSIVGSLPSVHVTRQGEQPLWFTFRKFGFSSTKVGHLLHLHCETVKANRLAGTNHPVLGCLVEIDASGNESLDGNRIRLTLAKYHRFLQIMESMLIVAGIEPKLSPALEGIAGDEIENATLPALAVGFAAMKVCSIKLAN